MLARVVARNAAWLVAGRVAILGLSGVISILIARHLGAEEFGKFSLIYAYLALFMWMGTFGMENILIRETAKARDRGDELFSVGHTCALVFSLVALVLAATGTFLLSCAPQIRVLILIAACEVLLFQPFYLLRFIFRVELKQWIPVVAEIVVSVLRLGIVLGLVLWKASLPWFVVGKLLCAAAFAASLLVLSRQFVKVRWHVNVPLACELLKEAWPLGVMALFGMIMTRLDQLMLNELLNVKAVGLYAASWTLVQFFGIFPNSLMASLFPVMSRRVGNTPEVARLARLGFKYSMMVIWPIAMIMTLWADDIIARVYGAKFAGAGAALALLIWAMPSAFFGVVLRDTLITTCRQRYLLWMHWLELVVCVVLNFLLIPRFGIAGAAAAAIGHNVAANLLMPSLFVETRRFVVIGLRQALTPALGCLGIYLVWTLSPSLVAGALAAALAYLGLVILLRGIDRTDVQYLRAVVGWR